MFKSVINISDLKSVINAIDNLQECGKDDDAKRLLVDMANQILESVK